MPEKIYLCIDLKSFYASVECVARGLDPLTTNLVVADPERESGTICLAVSPSLKRLGVLNRCRVFQIPSGINYIMAPPRMKKYIECSADIYAIYLKYISREDIHVYSIDEAFLDVTDYLPLYRMRAKQLGQRMMDDIRDATGIPAACGIGTNLYLAKIALDITAKHSPDFIGYLDEELYRRTLWDHRPITDFWRIGPGLSGRLSSMGITSMGEVAHMREDLLYKAFGVDAEYLIDHAWGREPTTIAEIKAYKSKTNSLSTGQVLFRGYRYEEGLLIVKEMVDLLCLDLVDKGLVTDSISLYIGYYKNAAKSSNGTCRMSVTTNSVRIITGYFTQLYERIINKDALVHRVNITFNNVLDEAYEQYDLFTEPAELERDRKIQLAVLDIKKKFGNNAVFKGMNLVKGATTLERNQQIGGHKSGESTES
nr:DNA repair protein [uncultured Eisenbergiella sp.]